MSVSFTDDAADYNNDEYMNEESPIGRVLIPIKELDIIGPVAIRYERHPWIERFEVDGLKPHEPVREGFGTRTAKSFVESLAGIYSRAYEDYQNYCDATDSESGRGSSGFNAAAYFSDVARYYLKQAGDPNRTKMVKMFFGLVENMWRFGTAEVHDIVMESLLPVIESDERATLIFYEKITPEFKLYIEGWRQSPSN